MHSPQQHIFVAKAPSNIALVKYWGKRDEAAQWPANDSLSMTLSHAFTTTKARAIADDDFRFELNGVPLHRQSAAGAKIYAHLDRLAAVTGR